MKIDIALLADAATVDASGKLNVLGSFHRLRGPDFPLRHGRVALVLRFALDPGDQGRLDVSIRMAGPDDQTILQLNGQVDAGPGDPDDRIRIPQVLNLDGVVFPTPGLYRFVVEVGGEEVQAVPLLVEQSSGERRQPGSPPGGGRGPTPILVPPGSEGGVQA
ncbi:MAG: hypothetical protein EA422_02890 [Gemmatimonadales bacterium]|nr:MAG: hypothetical protein EA422_02890 [Gemmatimonadales bacterium]